MDKSEYLNKANPNYFCNHNFHIRMEEMINISVNVS